MTRYLAIAFFYLQKFCEISKIFRPRVEIRNNELKKRWSGHFYDKKAVDLKKNSAKIKKNFRSNPLMLLLSTRSKEEVIQRKMLHQYLFKAQISEILQNFYLSHADS